MTKDVGMRSFQPHVVSEFLKDRYPYLEEIRGHLQEDDVSMASGDRMFPRLVELLRMPDIAPEKLSEALCTVCDLCAHQENKCLAISSGVVEAATHLLMHSAIEVRRDAARVITSVSQVIGGRSLMPIGNQNMPKELLGNKDTGPTLPLLIKLLLECDDELVKRNVAEAMCSVTIFRDGCQQVVDMGAVQGAATYLCRTLPALPPSPPLAFCLLFLLRTLAAVTMYAAGAMRDVLGVGLIQRVLQLVEAVPPEQGVPCLAPADSTEMSRQALRFLWHCGSDAAARREMLQADGVRIITRYLTDKDAKVREAACCALNVASLETPGKREVLRHSLEPLAALLHSDGETTYLHETCVQLCRCASELPDFRFALARHVVGSIWLLEKVYGTAAMAAVSPLLSPAEEDQMRAQAAKVMVYFLQQKEPARGDEIRVPPVSPLEFIEIPAMFAIEECMDVLHNLVDILSIDRASALACLEALTDYNKPRVELAKLIGDGRVKIPGDARDSIDAMLRKTS